MKTLLVEDDADLRAFLATLLSKRDYQIKAFATAEAAWESCQGETFDLAILDWMLPGISGLELCRRLRSQAGWDRTLVVVLTGRVGPEDLEEVLAAEADDYWTKPVDVQRLSIRLGVAERQARNIARRSRAEDAMRESVERLRTCRAGHQRRHLRRRAFERRLACAR